MNNNGAKGVVAFLLCAAMLVGGGAVGYGMATDWTYEKGVQIEQPDEEQPEQTGDNTSAVITPGEENGVQMMTARIMSEDFAEYGISPLAESAYSLTATVTPSNAGNKAVDWSVSWVNPSSSWVIGKTVTDYVKVTPTSDGALTANVECFQDFGAQIEITVTSRENPEATAFCLCDYYKKVEGVTIEFEGVDGNSANFTLSASNKTYTSDDENGYAAIKSITPVYSAYTVDDTFDIDITAKGNSSISTSPLVSADVRTHSNLQVGDEVGVGRFVVNYGFVTYSTSQVNEVCDALISSVANPYAYRITVTATGAHSTYTVNYDISATDDALTLVATSISLDENRLYW